MIEIDDIRDRASLFQWLREWPQEKGKTKGEARAIAVAIAHRAAMRDLPLWWDWTLGNPERKRDVTALPVLHSNLISGVAAKSPTPEIELAAEFAASSASAVRGTADTTLRARAAASAARDAATAAAINIANSSAGFAASTTAGAAAFSAVNSANPSANFAASTTGRAAAIAANTVRADAAIWTPIRSDCKKISAKEDVLAAPLWSNLENPLETVWRGIKSGVTAPEWSFWIKWYDDALVGNPPNWKMLEQIALIESEVWDAGPEAVATRIAEIQLGRAVAATPNAEDISINDAGKYEAVARSNLPAQTLQDANERIGDVIRQIRAAQETTNQYTGLIPEADLLEERQRQYADNALRLHEVCYQVVRHIGGHVANGVLPDNDNLVGDVTSDLQNNADDIYNFDEEVRKTVDARAKLRFERLSDQELDRVIALTEAVADRSEGSLAEELREDEMALAANSDPSEEEIASRYRLGSRLLRVVALGGKLLKDVSEALLWTGGIGGGLSVFWWIIRVLLGL